MHLREYELPSYKDKIGPKSCKITCQQKGPSKSKIVCPLTSTCLTNVPKMEESRYDTSENGCPKIESGPYNVV